MPLFLNHYHHEFNFPPAGEPAWAEMATRWHQMDAPSFGFSDAFVRFKNKMGIPSLIILASPLASNESDFSFANSGAIHPTKMIHTLPNVRVNALLNILDWSGPTLCLQNDPRTIQTALSEAFTFVSETNPVVWVVSAHNFNGTQAIDFFVLRTAKAMDAAAMNPDFVLNKNSEQISDQSDPYFLSCLASHFKLCGENYYLSDGINISPLKISLPVSSHALSAYIPHRPPMLWIHEVLWATPTEGACLILPQELTHTQDDYGLRQSSAVEWMAQASGFIKACQQLNFGYTQMKETKNAYLVSLRNIELMDEFSSLVASQNKIIVFVQTIRDLDPFSIIRAQIKTKTGDLLAQGELKVFIE